MLDRLTARGYLPGRLDAAFRNVDRAAFVPAALRRHASLDVPLPLGPAADDSPAYSPRALALMVLVLDIEPGQRVLVASPDGGYLAAIATELAGPTGHVTVATGTPKGAAAAARRLRAAGYGPDRVRAAASAPLSANTWDRILLTEEASVTPASVRRALTELGVLVTRTPRRERIEIVRTVRSGDDYAELHVGDLATAQRPLGAGVEEDWPLRRLLALEEAARRVWTGEEGSAEEAEFSRAVIETWRPKGIKKKDPKSLLARSFFHLGYVYLMAGDLDVAEDCFRASLKVLPTAEGYTFLGWTWSFSGRFEEAIDVCRTGLGVDPTFGNAYNDIGAYYIELGDPDEAEAWLEKAIDAPRYAARAYPYVNLARVRLMSGDEAAARAALEAALDLDPEYGPAQSMLNHLDGTDEDEEAGVA